MKLGGPPIEQATDSQSRNVIRIFLMVLLAIVADQVVESVILEAVSPLKFSFGKITNIFLLSTMPFALILAAWSDFHCRRKTMIFALLSLSISAILITLFKGYNNLWVLYTSLIFKGIGGNVTPVALASLATIVPKRKFTIFLAIAICAYSVGLWVPIYLHSFKNLPFTATFLSLICTLFVFLWFRESKFDDFQLQKNTASLRKFFSFLKKDLVAIALFAVGVTVILALLGFLASEISYYQILLRGEVLGVNPFYSNISIKMAVGYYVGTILLIIFLKNNISDSRCLSVGILCSILSLLSSSLLSTFGVTSSTLFNLLFAFFSIGSGLLTPCIFSILSKVCHADEQGKIYGFLDTIDTLAAYVGVKYIGATKNTTFPNVLWFSTVVFFVSAVIIFAFIRDIKEREENYYK